MGHLLNAEGPEAARANAQKGWLDDFVDGCPAPLCRAYKNYRDAKAAGQVLEGIESDGAYIFYHGTDVDSAVKLLLGAPLSAEFAGNNKIDGKLGFYLATDYADTEYFALRRGEGAVLQYSVSTGAFESLITSGSAFTPIPPGKTFTPNGYELLVPPSNFTLFDELRSSGQIVVSPSQ